MNPIRRSLLMQSISMGSFLMLGEKALAQKKSSKSLEALRLVSIGGALTEMIYLLNSSKALVGVDTTSLYPDAARKLPNVGYARSLSSEGILALKPTQVIAIEDAGPPVVLRQIANAGIPLTVLQSNLRFDGVLDRIHKIGELIDKAQAAKELIQNLNLEWAKTQNQLTATQLKKIDVLFILSQNPTQVMVSGTKTSADAMISYAGANNAISGFSGYKPLTPEAMIAANPDIILMTAQGIEALGGVDGVLRFPGISKTTAGKQKKIISLEAMYMLGFGPRMPLAVRELNRLLAQTVSLS